MHVQCVAYNLLFRPTNAQYVNSNVYIIKYSEIYIIFRESFLMYAKVTKSVKLIK